MDDLFLSTEQLAQLTGRRAKSRQIAWLKGSGIPFRVNATGHPVVARAAVEGREPAKAPAPAAAGGWASRALEEA